MEKSLKLSEWQISLLKDVVAEERKFLDKLEERSEYGFFAEIDTFHNKVNNKCKINSAILYTLCYDKDPVFNDEDFIYLKDVVEMHYKMQRLFVEKFKNQVWWSEGRPKDATSESLEEGVPDEHIMIRDGLKELLEALDK